MRTIAVALGLVVFLVGCSSSPPYRESVTTSIGACMDAYERAGHGELVSDEEFSDPRQCFQSSREKTRDYDLFFVEFDDQGWLASAVGAPPYRPTQLSTLMVGLNDLIRSGEPDENMPAISKDRQPLSIVVYVHGWHHSAMPNDSNVRNFRRLLRNTAHIETDLCLIKREQILGARLADPASVCTDDETVVPWQKRRRVVGIFIGWRGDSLFPDIPWLNWISVWDRKLAAEKVALGAVQELFAKLHDFYLEHSCHLAERSHDGTTLVLVGHRDATNCADVRMLTIGHSFGGLITYRALAPRLMAGVVEKFRQNQMPGDLPYAYSFGDLAVLVNPAFEGTRFEPLAAAASGREYQVGDGAGLYSTAQLPILIVATSNDDWVTRWTFPAFRFLTTIFETKRDLTQWSADLNTVGWTRRYQTHVLSCSDERKVCVDPPATSLQEALRQERAWYQEQRKNTLRSFNDKSLDLAQGLSLRKIERKDPPIDALPLKDFMPLWVARTDTNVIPNHGNFLTRNFANFVRQIYYVILGEEDMTMVQFLGTSAKRQ